MPPLALTILGDPSVGLPYADVKIDDIKRMAIFPPIGIARVGDSDKECFLAPEVPGHTSPPEGLRVDGSQVCSLMFPRPQHTRSHAPPYDLQEFKFRDAHQKLRRQVPPSINLKS